MDLFKKKAFESIFGDPIQLALLLLISIGLGLAIAWTYKKTHRSFSYSQSFSVSIILITAITTLIILLIQDSVAAAIGIFGAFSIVRFRTAVKDTIDVAFIFFALCIGLAIGMGAIGSALIGTAMICALIIILHQSNFGSLRKFDYVLNFQWHAKNHSSELFQTVIQKYAKKQNLLNAEARNKGELLIFSFNITLQNESDLNDFLMEMNKLEGISDVSMVSSKNDLEF